MITPFYDIWEVKSYAPEPGVYRDALAELLWRALTDIPFLELESGELVLDDHWAGFEPGTEREEIWHVFDDIHSKGVAYLLNETNPLRDTVPQSDFLPPLDEWSFTERVDQKIYRLEVGHVAYRILEQLDTDPRYPEADIYIGSHWEISVADQAFDCDKYDPNCPPIECDTEHEAFAVLALFAEEYEKHPLLFDYEKCKPVCLSERSQFSIDSLCANVKDAQADCCHDQKQRENSEVER